MSHGVERDRKSTRLNSSHANISYAVFCYNSPTDIYNLSLHDALPISVLFTILAGAKRHHLEPWAYLRDVLLHLSAGETDLESLLPDRWASIHPEHVLRHRLDESRRRARSEEHTSELQSRQYLVCRLLL